MPVKSDRKQLYLIKLNRIHASALSWLMILAYKESTGLNCSIREKYICFAHGFVRDLVGVWNASWVVQRGTTSVKTETYCVLQRLIMFIFILPSFFFVKTHTVSVSLSWKYLGKCWSHGDNKSNITCVILWNGIWGTTTIWRSDCNR